MYRLRAYGISIGDFQSLLLAQGNACFVCQEAFNRPTRDAQVDHDHVTGIVRGLLCKRCNLVLGAIKDDQGVLLAMYEYLIGFGHGRVRRQVLTPKP